MSININLNFLKDNPRDIIFKNSGGPDCAILMYIIYKYVKENNLDIKMYHVSVNSETKVYYVKHALKVIQFLEDTFDIPCEEFLHKMTKVTSIEGDDGSVKIVGYAEAQSTLAKQLMERYPRIGYIMTGVSNMIPDSIISDYMTSHPELYLDDWVTRDITRTGKNISSAIMKNDTYIAYHPFINHTKLDIKKLYDEYECTDTLYPLTRSCEIHSYNKKYETILNNHNNQCGQCRFCIERLVAFGRL